MCNIYYCHAVISIGLYLCHLMDYREYPSNVPRTLRHLRPRAFDLIKCDATTFAHAAEDTVGPVEELLWGVELLKETSAMY